MSASMRRVRVVQWLRAAVLVSKAVLGVDAVGDVLRAVLLAGLADLVAGACSLHRAGRASARWGGPAAALALAFTAGVDVLQLAA